MESFPCRVFTSSRRPGLLDTGSGSHEVSRPFDDVPTTSPKLQRFVPSRCGSAPRVSHPLSSFIPPCLVTVFTSHPPIGFGWPSELFPRSQPVRLSASSCSLAVCVLPAGGCHLASALPVPDWLLVLSPSSPGSGVLALIERIADMGGLTGRRGVLELTPEVKRASNEVSTAKHWARLPDARPHDLQLRRRLQSFAPTTHPYFPTAFGTRDSRCSLGLFPSPRFAGASTG